MKRNFLLMVALLLSVTFVWSCKKEVDNNDEQKTKGQKVVLKGDIMKDSTIKATDTVVLSGFVYVKNSATLTIEAGSVIKGVSGTKATLVIERGSKIMAAGTANKPIVFTSDKPAGSRSYGDWGGIVLCGNAPTNKHDNGAGVGVAEGGIGSEYGGNKADDNSGVLQYVRIEFAGIALTSTANSEVNGLTLYAVGSSTIIDHIQVSYSGDDSYEWFGGNVNCKYLVAYRGWDDDFDTDNGYAGNVQFAVSLRDHKIADQSTSNGFESDNDADGSTLTPVTSAVFSNVSVFGPWTNTDTTGTSKLYGNAAQLRRGTRLSLFNSVLAGYPNGLYIDGAKGDSPTQAKNGSLQIENCIMSGMKATSNNKYINGDSIFALKNEVIAKIADLKVQSLDLVTPNFVPASGSALLSGAVFSNTKVSGSFFTKVSYRGAFGNENWTAGWCNFDPQNTKY